MLGSRGIRLLLLVLFFVVFVCVLGDVLWFLLVLPSMGVGWVVGVPSFFVGSG